VAHGKGNYRYGDSNDWSGYQHQKANYHDGGWIRMHESEPNSSETRGNNLRPRVLAMKKPEVKHPKADDASTQQNAGT
jgi:hypothetical protein